MIEIRGFEGDIEELTQFIATTWRQNYQGRMPVPHWTADFFARDAWPDDHTARQCHSAAYDGTRLVGVLPGWPISVVLHGERTSIPLRSRTMTCR